MSWDWEAVKEGTQAIYSKLSQLTVFLLLCFYLLSCVVAGGPVSLRSYVGFVYHCFQWQLGPAPNVKER